MPPIPAGEVFACMSAAAALSIQLGAWVVLGTKEIRNRHKSGSLRVLDSITGIFVLLALTLGFAFAVSS